jgi:hypothetical protein
MNKRLLKMHLIDDTQPLLFVGAPYDFVDSLKAEGLTIHTAPVENSYQFICIYGYTQDECEKLSHICVNMFKEDGLFWIVYPTKSSKKYDTDCSFNTLFTLLDDVSFRPVEPISIDDDLSAIRYRHQKYLKQ